MSGEDVPGNFVAGMLPDINPFERVSEDISNDKKAGIGENDSIRSNWELFGRVVPKNEVIFICQVVILYIVIVTCIINLSLKNGDSNLWVALLSSSLGIMLPQPTLSQNSKK